MESAPSIKESKEKIKFVSLNRSEPGLVSVILSQELQEKLGEKLTEYSSSVAESYRQILDTESLYEVIFNEQDLGISVRSIIEGLEISENVMKKLQNEADALSDIL